MKKQVINNPVENVSTEIWKKLVSYPISFNEIIDCVLKAQNEICDACNPKLNNYTHIAIPQNDSTEWGCKYENEFRERMNNLGKLHFEPGDHNTGEDLTCDNPQYSMEIKTTQSSAVWNTNSSGRKHKSTKYSDPNKKVFYVLIRHEIDRISNKEATTTVKSIKFGMLSKNDWKNPKGTGAAYLHKDIVDKNFIEIWNQEIGNTIEAYQAQLDNDYYEKESEINMP